MPKPIQPTQVVAGLVPANGQQHPGRLAAVGHTPDFIPEWIAMGQTCRADRTGSTATAGHTGPALQRDMRARYPLTEPAVRPAIMNRCASM